MSQFVVGQWVECVYSRSKWHTKTGEFYRITEVASTGPAPVVVRVDGGDMWYGADNFKACEWQVGKTYKTTLEGVTATIRSASKSTVMVSLPYWMHPTESIQAVDFDAKTGLLVGLEDRTDVPHLTPYLATPDEPKKEPSRSEQIRDDAAKALEKVTGGIFTAPNKVQIAADESPIDKLISEYEAHAAMNEKIAEEYRDRAEMQRAMVKRAKELKGGDA